MANYDASTPRRCLPVFFLLAPEYSEKDAQIQRAIVKEIMSRLCDNGDFVAKYAFLKIGHSTAAQPESLSDTIPSIQRTPSIDIEHAFVQLNQALSRKAMLTNVNGHHLPVIVYVGTCNQDISKELQLLKDNKWFQRSTRFAVCYEERSIQHLLPFSKSPEACFCVGDEESMIKVVGVIINCCRPVCFTGSMLNSPDNSFIRVDPVKEDNTDGSPDDDDSGWSDDEW